jgi:hypothetical protein
VGMADSVNNASTARTKKMRLIIGTTSLPRRSPVDRYVLFIPYCRVAAHPPKGGLL